LSELVDAVRRLRAGDVLVPHEEMIDLLRFAAARRQEAQQERRRIDTLTKREREVLEATALGLSSKEIAARLCISLRTERNHVANILAKLNAHSQLAALVLAARYGVIEIPSSNW
jgi:DNA-binding NarL/FixJ family response regulator